MQPHDHQRERHGQKQRRRHSERVQSSLTGAAHQQDGHGDGGEHDDEDLRHRHRQTPTPMVEILPAHGQKIARQREGERGSRDRARENGNQNGDPTGIRGCDRHAHRRGDHADGDAEEETLESEQAAQLR